MSPITFVSFFCLSIIAITNGKEFAIKSHSKDQTIQAGYDFELYAQSNTDWKHCVWTRKSDKSFCLYTYYCSNGVCDEHTPGVWSIESFCNVPLGSRTIEFVTPNDLQKGNNYCGIKVKNATVHDSSEWTCKLEACFTGCFVSGINDSASMKVTVE